MDAVAAYDCVRSERRVERHCSSSSRARWRKTRSERASIEGVVYIYLLGGSATTAAAATRCRDEQRDEKSDRDHEQRVSI